MSSATYIPPWLDPQYIPRPIHTMPLAPSLTWSTLFTAPNLDPVHARSRTPHARSPRPEPFCGLPRLLPLPPSNSLSFCVQTVALRSITLSSCPGTTSVASARNGSVVLHRVASKATFETAGTKSKIGVEMFRLERTHVSPGRTKRCWSRAHTRRKAKTIRWLLTNFVSELLRPLRMPRKQKGQGDILDSRGTRRTTAPQTEEPRSASMLVPLGKPNCLPAAARRVSCLSHRQRRGSLVLPPRSPGRQPPKTSISTNVSTY